MGSERIGYVLFGEVRDGLVFLYVRWDVRIRRGRNAE